MKQLEQFRHIHFVGIGGAGMSALAAELLTRGFRVTGSDLADNEAVMRLKRRGAAIHHGHRAELAAEADLIVVSSAIGASNPERLEAERLGKPMWRRARVLAEVMRGAKGLAVSGTHGKSTTTSMMALAMIEAGLDPTALIGADLESFGGNARSGEGEWVVAEADESDASFLELEPDHVIVTNIEADHLDYYRDLDHIVRTFGEFLGRLRPGGKIVGCIDSPPLERLLEEIGGAARTYSLSNPKADLYARNIRPLRRSGTIRFTPVYRGHALGSVRLGVPGRHNVANALGVILSAIEIGCPFETITKALAEFKGAKRRFELKGVCSGVTVIDDYAHHPTEIRATLEAARNSFERPAERRIVSVFQPHRYSRTALLASEFGRALCDCDLLIVTDVYGAGEEPIAGVSGSCIFEAAVQDGHPNAHYIPAMEEVVDFLRGELREGDLVLTLGAGDVWRLGESLLADLRSDELAGKAREQTIAGAA